MIKVDFEIDRKPHATAINPYGRSPCFRAIGFAYPCLFQTNLLHGSSYGHDDLTLPAAYPVAVFHSACLALLSEQPCDYPLTILSNSSSICSQGLLLFLPFSSTVRLCTMGWYPLWLATILSCQRSDSHTSNMHCARLPHKKVPTSAIGQWFYLPDSASTECCG